jgi:hypothetical protein
MLCSLLKMLKSWQDKTEEDFQERSILHHYNLAAAKLVAPQLLGGLPRVYSQSKKDVAGMKMRENCAMETQIMNRRVR